MRSIFRPDIPFPDLERATSSLVAKYHEHGQLGTFKPRWSTEKWRDPRVLGALHALHGESCAYCQGPLTPSDRGDVEHFRPKAIYWWLGYDFRNYFLSCARCNRIRKSQRFPLAAGENGLSYGDGRTEDDEQQLLLDPSRDDVGKIALKLRNGFWMLSAVEVGGVVDPQAAETIRFFELNLGSLPVFRQRAIADATEEAQRVRSGSGNRIRLAELASTLRPFGFAVRRVLESGGYADLLPSRDDEVRLLLGDLRLRLESFDHSLADLPGHQDTMALRQTALWSMAVLWKWPPAPVTPESVEAWIGDGYREEARRLLARLATEAIRDS